MRIYSRRAGGPIGSHSCPTEDRRHCKESRPRNTGDGGGAQMQGHTSRTQHSLQAQDYAQTTAARVFAGLQLRRVSRERVGEVICI